MAHEMNETEKQIVAWLREHAEKALIAPRSHGWTKRQWSERAMAVYNALHVSADAIQSGQHKGQDDE